MREADFEIRGEKMTECSGCGQQDTGRNAVVVGARTLGDTSLVDLAIREGTSAQDFLRLAYAIVCQLTSAAGEVGAKEAFLQILRIAVGPKLGD